MKKELNQLQDEIAKLKFHNSCLLYLIDELRHNKKLKTPTMQDVCVLFDLSNDELKVVLKNIQSFDGDLDRFSHDTLNELNKKISANSLFFIIKGIKNSTNGTVKQSCKKLLKLYKE